MLLFDIKSFFTRIRGLRGLLQLRESGKHPLRCRPCSFCAIPSLWLSNQPKDIFFEVACVIYTEVRTFLSVVSFTARLNF
jgi:hypothetical protein